MFWRPLQSEVVWTCTEKVQWQSRGLDEGQRWHGVRNEKWHEVSRYEKSPRLAHGFLEGNAWKDNKKKSQSVQKVEAAPCCKTEKLFHRPFVITSCLQVEPSERIVISSLRSMDILLLWLHTVFKLAPFSLLATNTWITSPRPETSSVQMCTWTLYVQGIDLIHPLIYPTEGLQFLSGTLFSQGALCSSSIYSCNCYTVLN